MIASFYANGQRKYLTPNERVAFPQAPDEAERETRRFCRMLAQTDCRVSEALTLTDDRVDMGEGDTVLGALQNRRGGFFRTMPGWPAFLNALNMAHGLKEAQMRRDHNKVVHLWTIVYSMCALSKQPVLAGLPPRRRACGTASASNACLAEYGSRPRRNRSAMRSYRPPRFVLMQAARRRSSLPKGCGGNTG